MVKNQINICSRLAGITTCDQRIFVRREVFEWIGCYLAPALMEDIILSRLLQQHGWPVCLRPCLQASSRRWERDSMLSTTLLMWRLRLAYKDWV